MRRSNGEHKGYASDREYPESPLPTLHRSAVAGGCRTQRIGLIKERGNQVDCEAINYPNYNSCVPARSVSLAALVGSPRLGFGCSTLTSKRDGQSANLRKSPLSADNVL
jgi:hypothetical protein